MSALGVVVRVLGAVVIAGVVPVAASAVRQALAILGGER